MRVTFWGCRGSIPAPGPETVNYGGNTSSIEVSLDNGATSTRVNGDRGTWRGNRAVWGGRAHGRAGRYMSTLAAVRHNPVLKAFYERLRAVGKAPKVALTACMHKLLLILNAIVHSATPWRQPSLDVGA